MTRIPIGILGAIVLAAVTSVGQPKFAQTITDLGTLGGPNSTATAVSDGQVVGWAYTSPDKYHAFSWTAAGGMVDLGTLGADFDYSEAVAVSNGQVVGWVYTSSDTTRAFSWTAAGGMVDLGTLGGNQSKALAVADGQVVGWVGWPDTLNPTYHAVLFSTSLTPPLPCFGDFNNDGQVTIDEILIAVNSALNGCR